MNYINYAIDELIDYGQWKFTVDSLDEEIQMLEDINLKGIDYSKDRIQGGDGSDSVDGLLTRMMEREHKKDIRSFILGRMQLIESALNELDDRERFILEKMYVDKIKLLPREMESELGIKERQIQKLRHVALYNYTKYRVGISAI